MLNEYPFAILIREPSSSGQTFSWAGKAYESYDEVSGKTTFCDVSIIDDFKNPDVLHYRTLFMARERARKIQKIGLLAFVVKIFPVDEPTGKNQESCIRDLINRQTKEALADRFTSIYQK